MVIKIRGLLILFLPELLRLLTGLVPLVVAVEAAGKFPVEAGKSPVGKSLRKSLLLLH
jgi:hypothetical protein